MFICCCFLCPPDCVPPGAGRRPGAGGDGTNVSAEWCLGRGALRSLWRANQSSAAGLQMIQPFCLWFGKKNNNDTKSNAKQENASSSKMAEEKNGVSLTIQPL